MENDILDLDGICQVLNKKKQAVRKSLTNKEIPGTKIMGSWYSSRLALSMCVAGYDAKELYKEMSKKVLEKTIKTMV